MKICSFTSNLLFQHPFEIPSVKCEKAIQTIWQFISEEAVKHNELVDNDTLQLFRKCLSWPCRYNKIEFEAKCTKVCNDWREKNATNGVYTAIFSAEHPG